MPTTRQTIAVLYLFLPHISLMMAHKNIATANIWSIPNVMLVLSPMAVVTRVIIPAKAATLTALLKLFLEKEHDIPQSRAKVHTTMS